MLSLRLSRILLASFRIFRQTDRKAFIALRSVAHMAVVTLGLMSSEITGRTGALALRLAHGLVRPGLFVLVGGSLYN